MRLVSGLQLDINNRIKIQWQQGSFTGNSFTLKYLISFVRVGNPVCSHSMSNFAIQNWSTTQCELISSSSPTYYCVISAGY